MFVVGSGVSMGPLSDDTQPPPSSADSAWFLTKISGFGLHDDGRRSRAPPLKPPWFFEQETATELGFRFPFICGFKQHRPLRGRLLGLFDWAFPPAFGCRLGWVYGHRP